MPEPGPAQVSPLCRSEEMWPNLAVAPARLPFKESKQLAAPSARQNLDLASSHCSWVELLAGFCHPFTFFFQSFYVLGAS